MSLKIVKNDDSIFDRELIVPLLNDPNDSLKSNNTGFDFLSLRINQRYVNFSLLSESGERAVLCEVIAQGVLDYCVNTFAFNDGDEYSYRYLNRNGDFLLDVLAGEEVQILSTVNAFFQSRGVGDDDEDDFFLILATANNKNYKFNVGDHDYILLMYETHLSLSNLRYALNRTTPDDVLFFNKTQK